MGHSLALALIIAPEQPLVLLMGTELDGSVGDDANHGGRVATPQAKEAILQVGAVDQPVGLLRTHTHRQTHTNTHSPISISRVGEVDNPAFQIEKKHKEDE